MFSRKNYINFQHRWIE